MQAGEDLGEPGDEAGEDVQMLAAFAGFRQFRFLLAVQVVRVGEDPAGQVTRFGRPGDSGRAAAAPRNGST